MTKRKLPIGLQTLREIREDGWYYVDKTGYLTIHRSEPHGGMMFYRLGYPNREVRQSLNESLLSATVRLSWRGGWYPDGASTNERPAAVRSLTAPTRRHDTPAPR